jgi:hypothetical protein
MPEIMDDQLAHLFTTLRAKAPGEITPPGVDSARRTVARRRSVRMAGMASLSLLLLAGVATAAVMLTGRGSSDPVGPGGEDLAAQALASLGYSAESRPAPPLLPVRPGVAATGVTGAADLTIATEPLPAGAYRLRLVCLGRGTVRVSWAVADAPPSFVDVTCNGSAVAGDLVTEVEARIAVHLEPDAEAVNHAGIAVEATDPRAVRAVGLLPAGPGLGAASGTLDHVVQDTDESGHAPGPYRLRVACVGVGTASVRFALDSQATTGTTACTAGGGTTTLTVVTTRPTTALTVTITPDAAANGNAGFAYRVQND